MHLVKDRDGLNHCPVTGYEHPGFTSQKGCRKHVKTKHGWYYYFDEKPNVSIDDFDTLASAANGTNEKASRTLQFLAALQIINSLVRFRSGFKAAVAGANLVNNRTFQSREL